MDGITVRIDQAIVIVMTFYSVIIYPKKSFSRKLMDKKKQCEGTPLGIIRHAVSFFSRRRRTAQLPAVL